MKKPSKLFSVLTSAALALFLLTGAVAAPILWRGFYYGQIDALSLPARTGFSPAVIRGAFDEVMDYLVKGAPFGTGELRWSESGMAHFADCKVLFQLDFRILEISAVFLLVILLLTATKKLVLHRFGGRGPCFWTFAAMAAAILVFGLWGLFSFESLFTAFHTLFFPGKDNWVFDYRLDQIILILPADFWARAAALVAGLAFGVGALLAVLEEVLHRVKTPKSIYEEIRRMEDQA